MTAEQITKHLLEAGVDPDDPAVFLRNYADAFQRLGFALDSTESGQPKWIWTDGPLSVEVVKYDSESAGADDIPYDLARQARATDEGYAVWAYISQPTQTHGDIKNAYAHRAVKDERKAVELAAKYQKELPTSMAARLTRLGFSGWKNHWHKSPIHVTLRPKYVNVDMSLRYVPNEQAIKALTALDKVRAKIFP